MPISKSRLATIFNNLNADISILNSTLEEAALERARVADSIVNMPRIIKMPDVYKNKEIAYPEKYNTLFQTVKSGLIHLNERLSYLSDTLVEDQAELEALATAVGSRLKQLSTLLNVSYQYNRTSTQNKFFFADSFTDLTNISYADNFTTTCVVLTNGGVLTLPIAEETQLTSPRMRYSVLGESNGDGFAAGHDIQNAFAGDNDYAEYIRTSSSGAEDLDLHLLLAMPAPDVVNKISIAVHNTGSQTWPRLVAIQTSMDNVAFTSISDIDPTLATIGITSSFERNVYLSPFENKFSRIYEVAFEPVKTAFIKLIFRQESPVYDTENNNYKYSITLQRIRVSKVRYAASGIAYSNIYTKNKNIGTATLRINSNIGGDSAAGKIKFSLSPDDAKWSEITPINEDENAELIVYNQPWFPGNIKTDTAVDSLRVRIEMQNGLTSFEPNAKPPSVIRFGSEITQVATAFPYTTNLQHSPVANTTTVLQFPFGRVDKGYLYEITNNLGEGNLYKFDIPAGILNEDSAPTLQVGETTVSSLQDVSSYQNTASFWNNTHNNCFIIDYDNNYIILRLYSQDGQRWWVGKSVKLQSGIAPIGPTKMTNKSGPYAPYYNKFHVTLPTYCDGIADNTQVHLVVYSGDDIQILIESTIIPQGIIKHQLSEVGILLSPAPTMTDAAYTPYIDGVKEFEGKQGGWFSIDTTDNILYRNHPTTSQQSLRYSRENRTVLASHQWSLLPDCKTIVFADSVFGQNQPTAYQKIDVKYNVAIPFDDDNIEIDGSMLTLSEQAQVESFYNEINPLNKMTRVIYQYQDDSSDAQIQELAPYFTPVLKDYTLTCTGI